MILSPNGVFPSRIRGHSPPRLSKKEKWRHSEWDCLEALRSNFIPVKSSLSYFKPYTIDVNGKIKYKDGEIDFVFEVGKSKIPIEVKAASEMSSIHAPILQTFIQTHNLPFGIILYQGVPFWDKAKRILYWPFWLV